MHGLLLGLELATTTKQLEEDSVRVMKEFDANKSGSVSKSEFKAGISRWVKEKLKTGEYQDPNAAIKEAGSSSQ